MRIIKDGRVRITDHYVSCLWGSGQDIVDQLERWSEHYGVALSDFDYESYDGVASITYWRDLTEAELKKEEEKARKTRERSKKLKETKEAKERAELARLQKKYGTIPQ